MLLNIIKRPVTPMVFDHKARPLPKVFFSKKRKPVSPFSEIIWSNSTHTYVKYAPKTNSQYAKVEGIKISPKLIVLRGFRDAYYPEVCKIIAKKFSGRIPDRKEMELIIGQIDRLNATFALLGDPPLCRGLYLIADNSSKDCWQAIDIEHPQQIKTAGVYDECFFIIVR